MGRLGSDASLHSKESFVRLDIGNRSAARLVPALVAATLLFAGCAPTPAPAPTETPASSEPSAEPTAAAPTPEPTSESAEAPAECEPVALAAGAVVEGADLGPCLQAIVVGHESGTLTLTGDELAGQVVYRYAPTFDFRADLETGDGPLALSFVDDVMMLDTGEGPVVGDRESSDPDEQMAGTTGELYRVFADPGFISDLIREGATWTVADAAEELALDDGTTVEAWRIDSDAPYSWFDIPVEAYAVWVTEEWAPVRAESTTGFLGRTTTITQQFSGLGDAVTITPLG